MSAGASSRAPGTKKPTRSRWRLLLGLALPSLILLPLVVISTFWHLPTRIQLELVTARLALILGGGERREVLARSVPFSSLVVEDCGTVGFAAETLEIADPQQLVPGHQAGEIPHFPTTAWRELKPAGPVKLSCRDPAAKLTLRSPDPSAARVGLLDRIFVDPGSQVILEMSPGLESAVSLEVETPQDLNLSVGTNLELVADFVKPEGFTVPFQGDLLTYRARLPESRRSFEITSGEHGLALIVTPASDQLGELFADPLDLPLSSLEALQESLEGALVSPLRDKATLSYPEYPDVPAVTIDKDEVVGLGGLSQARLRSLDLDPKVGALRVRFDGIANRAASRSGEFARDHRLTLFHAFRYSWRWGLIAVVATWLASTTWAAFEVWKKLQD
jgi:hypothetical protein